MTARSGRPGAPGRGASVKRREAEKRGRRAEAWAAFALRVKGYQVIARRQRSPVGEIDLIVRRGRIIAFVEVKQRPDVLSGLDAVTPTAQRRIARAARAWLIAKRVNDAFEVRFDVIVVVPRRWPAHIRDVWREDPLG